MYLLNVLSPSLPLSLPPYQHASIVGGGDGHALQLQSRARLDRHVHCAESEGGKEGGRKGGREGGKSETK